MTLGMASNRPEKSAFSDGRVQDAIRLVLQHICRHKVCHPIWGPELSFSAKGFAGMS